MSLPKSPFSPAEPDPIADSRCRPVNLQLVIPCFNEEAMVPEAARQFDALLAHLIERSEERRVGKECQ